MSEPEANKQPSPVDYYNTVFERLNAPNTIAGAIAYTLYKTAKREWVTNYKAQHGVRPSDAEIRHYSTTLTDVVLTAYTANANSILTTYADRVIQDVKPKIIQETLAGTFGRSFWPSFWASVSFASLLLVIVIIAALFGFGLPIQITIPTKVVG